MARWASGGIILSSVVTRYQLGLALHAGSRIVPLRAATPHGTWESAMNAAFSASTSAAKEAGEFTLLRDKKTAFRGRNRGDGGAGGRGLFKGGPGAPPFPGER